MTENTLKVLHTADLHLGSTFGSLPEQAQDTLRKEQKDVLFKMIRTCRDESADLLLLAGDIFDRPYPNKDLIRLLVNCLNEIPETEIFITPGNHDPYVMDSPWESENWPRHVHVFTPGQRSFVCGNKHVQVDGSAFSGYLSDTPLFGGVPRQVSDESFRLLMWHGDLTDQASDYNPLSPGAAFLRDYDYVAMGHIHKARETRLFAYGNVIARYPGCPQGRGFDEVGEAFFWLGEFAKRNDGFLTQNWKRVPVGTRPFLWLDCDLSGCSEIEQVKSKVLNTIRNETSRLSDENAQGRSLIRIVLKGRLPEDLAVDPEFIENYLQMKGCYYVQVRSEAGVIRDWRHLSEQPGFTGLLVQNYLNRISKVRDEQEKKELEQALEYALQAGRGEL